MKFEDLLMQRREEQKEELLLEDDDQTNHLYEAVKLQAELEKHQKLNTVLEYAVHRPSTSRQHRSPSLPLQVQELLAELAMVDEEIMYLERKVEELNLRMYHERKQTQEWEKLQQQCRKQKYHLCKQGRQGMRRDPVQPQGPLCHSADSRRQRKMKEREEDSLGSASEIQTLPPVEDDAAERKTAIPRQMLVSHEIRTEEPNRLSEELTKCLIGIFLRLNQPMVGHICQGSAIVPRRSLSCMNRKGFVSKTSFNCKEPMLFIDDKKSNLDHYAILSDIGIRDVGPYKKFSHLTTSSLDMSRISECFPAIAKLRVMMHKLCTVDLDFLMHKQKLAFWINIYNACIMHAFLQHGLPSTADKLLALMNKAAVNVGGIVLNALAIEHFILRHPRDSHNEKGIMDEKEMSLRHAYGLRYPEPNVTFALCRGSWSSPALRIYTAENVVDELGRAKTEYLQASIGVTSKKKIVVPKLLQWHMHDFADDMESLLEWIYSQLPQMGPLKKLIKECLNGESRSRIAKMVEVQPYISEFRYILPR